MIQRLQRYRAPSRRGSRRERHDTGDKFTTAQRHRLGLGCRRRIAAGTPRAAHRLQHGHTQAVPAASVGDGTVAAGSHTVKAHHTPAHIDRMRRRIDALRLATAHTPIATRTPVGINIHMV